MGFTLTAVVDGTPMSAATMTANITAIRNWLDGGIASGDIVAGSVKARHIRRLEHYLAGTANPRSEGASGVTTRRSYTSDPKVRVYVAGPDSHGNAVWEDVATVAHRFYVRDTGIMECVFEWWAWAIQSDQTAPEAYNDCDFRLMVNGTAIDASRITLFDAGYDASATDGGPFCYCARNFQAIVQRQLTEGWNNVKLQVNVANHAAMSNYALVIIGARNLHTEFWMR